MPTRTQRNVGTYILGSESNGRIVAALRKGSPSLITELPHSMRASDCTPDVVKATLANLRLELVPEDPLDGQSSEEEMQSAIRAVASIPVFAMIADSSYELPSVARYAVPLMLASLEGVIRWSEIALNLPLPYDQPRSTDFHSRQQIIARMFCRLLCPGMDKRLLDAVMSSQPFIHLLLKMWTMFCVYEGKRAPCGPWESPGQCGILLLLEHILHRGEPRKRLFETIHLYDLEEQFALATVQRAKQLRKQLQALGPEGSVAGFEDYTNEFVRVTGIGLYQQAHPTIRQALRDAGYIAQATKMVNDVSFSLINRGASNCLGELIQPLTIMVTIAHADEPNTLRNIRDLLASGYLEAFVRIMAGRQTNKRHREEADRAIETLNLIDEWTVYPSVCQILFNTLIPDADRMYSLPGVRDVWRPLWNLLSSRVCLWADMKHDFFSNMCDNPLCNRQRAGSKAKPRQCSHCGTVVYCSKECQRVDWGGRHRTECLPACAFQLARREDGSIYDHKSRAFHAKYIEKLYRQHAHDIDAKAKEQQRPINDFVPSFDCRIDDEPMDIYDTKDLLAGGWKNASPRKWPQKYLEARLTHLINMYTCSRPGSVRLAEGVFQEGTLSFINILVLLRETGGQIEVAYSVPRSSLRVEDGESLHV